MNTTILAATAALALCAGLDAHAADRPEAQIRALRDQSNAAFAAHDPDAIVRLYAPDYSVLPGSSGTPIAREGFRQRLALTFADPTFVTYRRTPTRIEVGTARARAAEQGRWLGTFHKPDGEMRITGVYQAMWVRLPEGWRLKNESFVTLGCTGSRECAGRD